MNKESKNIAILRKSSNLKNGKNIVGVALLGDPKRNKIQINKLKQNSAITLIALVITIIFSYDENIKSSNNKGFLLQTI